jgi:hypothetical protein
METLKVRRAWSEVFRALNENNFNPVWQTGLKQKIQQFVAYRRPISQTEISIGLGWKAGRTFTKPMVPENKQE